MGKSRKGRHLYQLDPADAFVHGGRAGHRIRRLTHLALALVPFVYYDALPRYAAWLPGGSPAVAIAVGGTLLLFEAVRLRYGLLVIGQRRYEAKRISGAAWTVSAGLVVLLAGEWLPGDLARAIGYPVFLTAAVIDPLVGECRRRCGRRTARLVGMVVAGGIWAGAWLMLGTPLAAAVAGPVVAVVFEGPWLAPIDDNATMLLLPWAVAVLAAVALG